MYSKRNPPSRVSGKNPAFQKDDYPTAMLKKTQQDLINEGKKFKFSVFKKPYADNSTYQEMEYEATPLGRIGLNLPPFPILNWDLNEPPTWDIEVGKEGGKEKCPDGCPGCVTEKKIPSMECQEGDGMIYSSSFIVCDKAGWKPKLESIEPTDELIILGKVPDKSGCNCDCYEMKFGYNCKGTNWEGVNSNGKPTRKLAVNCMHISAGSSCQCLPLTIVDEGGGAATDTILRNGSNDYDYTGSCCDEAGVEWSLSAGAGSSLGGSTITQGGVLTAGATACGSISVDIMCVSCGSSASQYVRVTDAGTGKWSEISRCGDITGCGCAGCQAWTYRPGAEQIEGNKKYIAYNCCTLPAACGGSSSYCSVVRCKGWWQCPELGCSNFGLTTCDNLDPILTEYCCTIGNQIFEWVCV